jgi:2-iminobutanoate/2-iminopropanoate deaminase
VGRNGIYVARKEGNMLKNILFLTVGLLLFIGGYSYSQKESSRKVINMPGRTVEAPFSDAILVGNTLYLSGKIGVDPKTGKAPESLDQEIRLLLDNTKATLGHAGMTMNDLVYVQVFCPDLSLYDQFNKIYRTYFSKDFPARGFIGSGPILRGGHFEMQGIAVK